MDLPRTSDAHWVITKIGNNVDKKEQKYEDIKTARFLQWKFRRYYIHAMIFWLYVEQTSNVYIGIFLLMKV